MEMTPRQQQASELRNKGMLQKQIATMMGITQSRVSSLLRLDKGYVEIKRKYLQTPTGRETNRRYSEQWRSKNHERSNEIARATYHRRKK